MKKKELKEFKNEFLDDGIPRINISKIDFKAFLKECPPNFKHIDEIYNLFKN